MLQFVLALALSQAPELLPDAGAEPLPAPAETAAALPVDAGAPAVAPAAPVAPDAGVETDDLDRRRTTVVTASRIETRLEDVVVPTEVINRATIEAQGARDLTQLMQQHPGVELVYTNRGVGIRMQGLDPEYVLVLVDGQRVAGRSGSITDLARFSLRNVERVEIIKGPAAALYGADAIGGVINLITRRPTKALEATLRVGGGAFLDKKDLGAVAAATPETDVRGSVGSKLGDFDLRLGGGYRTRAPYDWNPKDVADNGPGIKRMDGDFEAGWQPDAKTRVWARTGYVLTDLNAIDMNDTGAVFDRYQRTEQFDTWVGGKTTLSSDTSITARGHYGLFKDQFLVDQRGSTALDEYSTNLTRLWEGMAQVDQKWGGHLGTAGVESYTELLSSTRITPSKVNRNRVGVFLQDTWVGKVGDVKFTAEPGVRVDVDSQFGWAPSPRIAVKVDPLPQLTVRASWGMGFRPPTFSELYLQFSNAAIGYIVEGNPALKPERSNAFNASLDYRLPLDGWMVSASAWHTEQENLINITAFTPPNPDNPSHFSYANVTHAYSQGVEVSGRAKVSRGSWFEVALMALDARDLDRNRPLEGRSPFKANAQWTSKYRPLGLEFFVRGSWSAKRPFYSGTGLGFANVLGYGDEKVIWASAYFDLEAQVSWAVRNWVKVFVNGNNLLNAGDAGLNPRPPRSVLAGVQLDY